MTKKEVGKKITNDFITFMESKGFTEEDDQGYTIEFLNPDYKGDDYMEATITFYKGTLGCNSDPYMLAGPGYSNYEAPEDFAQVEQEAEIFLDTLINELS
tara:strand:- start:624 stop:923 length:300 start_codon:yes stop_codon:yes gene_type:complete